VHFDNTYVLIIYKCTSLLHKIVTLARFGIGSLMMVQMDRNI